MGGEVGFDLGDGEGAEVEDGGGEDGVGVAFDDAGAEVVEDPDAAGGDDGHGDGVGNGAGEFEVVAALGALVPSVWLQEHMPELPNLVEGEFDMIMKDRMGYFVVGLLAPLAEEMVFRGAILRSLLRWKSNPWIGIVISAILFAVIHMNPAQMPHAFLIGLLLGWMYWRTDSIVPGVVYHWVNNTVAYILYNIYPNPDLTLVELFGSEQKVLMALGFSLLIFLPSLYQLNQRLSK